MGRDHALSGVAVWAVGCGGAALAGEPAGPVVLLGGAAVCGWAALWPDLDQPQSLISRSLGPVSGLLSWLVRGLSWLAWRWVSTKRDRRGRRTRDPHRMLTHTLVFAVLTGWGLSAALPAGFGWLGWAAGLGCLVHTLGDMLTKGGCPLWWPVRIRGQLWRRVWLVPGWLRFRVDPDGVGEVRARRVLRVWLVLGGLVAAGLAGTLWELTQRVARAVMG